MRERRMNRLRRIVRHARTPGSLPALLWKNINSGCLTATTTPWYPSLRQFRQTSPSDWSRPIARVRDALQRLVAGDYSQLRPAPARGDPEQAIQLR